MNTEGIAAIAVSVRPGHIRAKLDVASFLADRFKNPRIQRGA
jgi:hypothetical protein